MVIFKKLKAVGVVTIVAMLFISTGCSRHPSEEQIRVLEEARSAALAAEQKLADKRQECAQLDTELAGKKRELDRVKQEREDVKRRLEQWPNWPES